MFPKKLIEQRKQLDDLLDVGKIQPSKVSFGAPALFQENHDRLMHMCVDYNGLKKVTLKNKYPIPLISYLFDRLINADYFTKLDLQSGFWQV